MAKSHLLWSPGFLRRTASCALVLGALVAAVERDPTCARWIAAAHAAATERLLRGAHALEWWAALSMLSSACCVLQLLLNALSFGCAGFNAWLGPLRPGFIAVPLHALEWGCGGYS